MTTNYTHQGVEVKNAALTNDVRDKKPNCTIESFLPLVDSGTGFLAPIEGESTASARSGRETFFHPFSLRIPVFSQEIRDIRASRRELSARGYPGTLSKVNFRHQSPNCSVARRRQSSMVATRPSSEP